jgi:hypothetical protein
MIVDLPSGALKALLALARVTLFKVLTNLCERVSVYYNNFAPTQLQLSIINK